VLATGEVTTLVTIGSQFEQVQGVATDGVNLYISHSNCALYRYELATQTLSVRAGLPGACAHVDGPASNARFASVAGIGLHGGDIFLAEIAPSSIRRIKVASGAVSTLADGADGLSFPSSVSSDGTYVYTEGLSATDASLPAIIQRVSIATGAVTAVTDPTGRHPITYANRTASTTNVADSAPFHGVIYDIVASNDGHNVYFIDGTGLGVITDAKAPPQLSVSDVTLSEGNGGVGVAVFTVRLSSPQPRPVTVAFLTNDGTATSGSGDYVGQSGLVTFPPGVVEQRVKVTVTGDATDELDESFKVRLAWPSGAGLGRAIGVATILDDDPGAGGATLALGDASIVEGDDLSALAVFPVRLSSAQPAPVSVNFATGDYNATAASGDFDARTGTVNFATGVTSATIFVKVNGDYNAESLEGFTLTLSGSSGPTISRAVGIGRIINDD
jgi:hypothetical protein